MIASKTNLANARRVTSPMGLVGWVAVGYLVLLLQAGLLVGALCRVAKLSALHGQTARGEVLLWGRIPVVVDTAATAAARGEVQSPVAGPAR